MKPIIYVAHPVTGDPVGNAMRATRWVRWLTLVDPSRVYVAPWVAEVLGFKDDVVAPSFYTQVLDDDMRVIRRLDGIIAVGGKWSGGMLQERAAAFTKGLPVVDWTHMVEPPEGSIRAGKGADDLERSWDAAFNQAWREVH